MFNGKERRRKDFPCMENSAPDMIFVPLLSKQKLGQVFWSYKNEFFTFMTNCKRHGKFLCCRLFQRKKSKNILVLIVTKTNVGLCLFFFWFEYKKVANFNFHTFLVWKYFRQRYLEFKARFYFFKFQHRTGFQIARGYFFPIYLCTQKLCRMITFSRFDYGEKLIWK